MEGNRVFMQRILRRSRAFMPWNEHIEHPAWPPQGTRKTVSNSLFFHKSIFKMRDMQGREVRMSRESFFFCRISIFLTF